MLTITAKKGRREDAEEWKTEEMKQKQQEATKYHRTETSTKTEAPDIHPSFHLHLTLWTTDVLKEVSSINAHKAADPDGILVRVLRACAEQLEGVFKDILNLSHTVTLMYFKTTSIVLVKKHSSANVPEQLPPCSTHSHCDEVLWAAGPGPIQDVPARVH